MKYAIHFVCCFGVHGLVDRLEVLLLGKHSVLYSCAYFAFVSGSLLG